MPDTSEPQDETKGGEQARRGQAPFSDPEKAREASRKGVEARRENAARRADRAEENALTFRQRLGVSLSKLTQAQLDQRVKDAKPSELVRFADQAFGRPVQAEDDTPKDAGLAELTREQRATLRAMLLSEEGAQQGEDSAQQGDQDPA